MVKAQSKECLASGGAIFLCSHLTRKECFEKKIFGLSPNYAEFVEKVKAGTTLFLYDIDQHKLHGVFEATSDGALDIIPDAYTSVGQRYPYQIRFKRIWFCKPLLEDEFQGAVRNSFVIKNKSTYRLSHQQVAKLLHLFSSRKRLQPPQNLRSQDDLSRGIKISSVVKETDVQSSPNSSSFGSFRSPCQTCLSSTLGEDAASLGYKTTDPVSLAHRVLQSDVSDMAKPNSAISSLHTGADTATVTIPSNQEAMYDQSTDDYIPLPQGGDVLEGIDGLFGLLENENHSSESKGSSDSEDCNAFHQACVRKLNECYPLMVNSKLRSDIERRKSVFSRIVRINEVFNQTKRSKTKAFPQMSAESFKPLYQMKKQRTAQQNKPFPCRNDGMLDKPSADRVSGVQALDNSFAWSDNRRSTKFSVRAEDRNKWDVSTNVSKGCTKWDKSSDRKLNTPPLIAGVQESSEVSVKEERTRSLNFKRRSKGLNVEGDQDFDSENIEEAGHKKRPAMEPFHEENPSDTALVPKGTKTTDMLAISDGHSKENGISLSSKDTHSQLARPYLDTKVLLQQQKRVEGCFEYGEDITSDYPLILESSRTMDSLIKQSFGDSNTSSNDETGSHVAAGHLGTETYIQEKQNQGISCCDGVVNGDTNFPLGNFGTMDFLPNHDEDCGNKRSLPSDGNDKRVAFCLLETEMPLLHKQTRNVQSCSEVVGDDKVLGPEISDVLFPKVGADCGYKGTSLGSDFKEEVCHLVSDCHEVVPSDAAPVLESCVLLSNLPTLHGDSANKNSSLDETSEHVSIGNKDPQDEHYHSCYGDTSSILEYTTMDICTGAGGSENNSSDQKDDEVLYSVTDSKDHVSTTNTSSSDGNQSCAAADDQESSKVMLPNEEQYQNFRSRPELTHENSNSLDSFAVSAEGCGGKSAVSTNSASCDQVTDLLGTNSESRTSFINDSLSRSVETLSTPALGSENVEAYAEPPILQHDPGEATPPL